MGYGAVSLTEMQACIHLTQVTEEVLEAINRPRCCPGISLPPPQGNVTSF
jgi:hypothetical protein